LLLVCFQIGSPHFFQGQPQIMTLLPFPPE
jgi:hypothetical protein